MKIIDIHTHTDYGTPYDCPETELHKRNFNFLMEEYKNVGIVAGGFSYYSQVLTTKGVVAGNIHLNNFIKGDDRVYQWIVLDPQNEETFAQVKAMINDKKVLGIKLHPAGHGYSILDYADKIFSFANELKCFVLMHPDKIDQMASYADKYPDMKLIIAHLGCVEHVEAIKNAKHKNIFTDTSGGKSSQNNVIEYAVEKVGSSNIFFGTDTYSNAFQVGRIKFARISEEDKQNILYNNAKKHFAKQFENL